MTVEANVFDHNRHDITSDGEPGSHYTATYNLVLDGAVEQSFDVHGGKDRQDCTNIAGSAFVIHHNTFLQSHKPAVRIRGSPVGNASLGIQRHHFRVTMGAHCPPAAAKWAADLACSEVTWQARSLACEMRQGDNDG